MKRLLLWAVLLVASTTVMLHAQSAARPFPEGVYTAKTVAIVNDTKQPTVEKGADTALSNWGQLKVVDDPQLADIVLRFEKATHHDGRDTQKSDSTGKPTDYGYEMSFSATITMKAFYKDSDTAFYSTRTDDSKAKAGTACIDALHTAWRTNAAQRAPVPQSTGR